MNRREALAALVAMPSIGSIERVHLKPSDVIVARAFDRISDRSKERIAQKLKDIWPDHKVVVLDDAMELKVMRAA